VLTPLAGWSRSLLVRLWPDPPPEHESQPKFIRPQALDDPETAMDLLSREIARLLAHVRGLLPQRPDAPSAEPARVSVEHVHRNFEALTERIEEFAAQLATHPLAERQAARLSRLREELAVVGYAEEAVRDLVAAVEAVGDRRHAEAVAAPLLPSVGELLDVAAKAAASLDAASIDAVRERSRPRGPFVEQVQPTLVGALGEDTPAARQAVLQVVTRFELVAWVLHRLAKLLPEIAPREIAERPESRTAAAPITEADSASRSR
jgi:phosphate:Na+ symporter